MSSEPQQQKPQVTGGTMPRNRSNEQHHKYIWKLIIILAAMFQVKSQEADKWPSISKPSIIITILVAQIYCVLMHLEDIMTESDIAEIAGLYARLTGCLVAVLLILTLMPILGWINLGIWFCCFFAVTHQSYQTIFEQLYRSNIGSFCKKLKEALAQLIRGKFNELGQKISSSIN